MATMLKDSLQTIQTHKVLSPHYAELLDILEEILILREEYHHRTKRDVFPVEEKLVAAKMTGGLPLVDFSSVNCDLTEAKDYFLALLEIAEKRSPGETGEMARKIRAGEINFNDLIYESFNPLPPEEEGLADEEGESSFDLVELFIEESLYQGLKWVVFEPNDEPLWAQIRLNVGAFMHGLFRQGAFQGSTPREAYFVKCDKETTTQNDINQGIVNIIVGFAPLKPAEFVILKIQQMAGQIEV